MKGYFVLTVCFCALFVCLSPAALFADECGGNTWQPTFVRHNSVSPTVFYFTGSTFIPVSSPQEAQQLCRNRGVRMAINGQTCAQRDWGGFGCGCNITPSPNRTCAAFQNFLRTYETNVLGRVWNEQESGWSGVWTRRGTSNTFDAVWTTRGQPQERAVLTIGIRGNDVNVARRQQRGTCTYRGNLDSDMRTVSGTYGCSWAPGPIPWRATIQP
ncbi:MAG TPA: hypothetical protein PLR60_08050 [Syntrophorhabdaceae bacterium]|nr:hypothetical protein [Syntrophorhabdaceae bacterium]